MARRALSIASILWFLQVPVHAQEENPVKTEKPCAGDLNVKVSDGRDPIASADVEVTGTAAGSAYQNRNLTGTQGHATFSGVPCGDVSVIVNASGWLPWSQNATVSRGRQSISATLQSKAGPPPPVDTKSAPAEETKEKGKSPSDS